MFLHILFTLFYFSNLCENVSWSPCPPIRSTFKDFQMDYQGRIRANCVCRNGLFGDQCQFKLYVPFNETHNYDQPVKNIYPIDQLNLTHSNDRRILISWRQIHMLDVQYFLIQLRDLQRGMNHPWRTIAYITKQYFVHKDVISFQFRRFHNLTMYELNLGLVSNDQVIFSLSLIQDTWSMESFQDISLHDIMFSASITWTSWSKWGKCETQHDCGKGEQRRKRILVNNDCVRNKTEETRPCKLKSCPVNGAWSLWSDWSACSLTCNNGTRSRLRTCTNPSPRYGGQNCFGISQIIKTCVNEACSVLPDGSSWKPIEKFKSLEFSSLIVGFGAGFTLCLMLALSPYMLKRCRRTLMKKIILLKNRKNLNTADHRPTQTTPKDTKVPSPPPVPAINWRPIPLKNCFLQEDKQKGDVSWPHVVATPQTQAANNAFMEELLKAFTIFNVDAKKTFKNTSSE